MGYKLFSEFNPVSAKQWKQKIQFDLKGTDYNDSLIWKTNENISVKPFYHADDFDELPEISSTKATQWKICQTIFVAHVEKSNLNAIAAIERGAESIQFIIPNKDISIHDLLKNIPLDNITIHLELQFLSKEFIKQIPNHTNISIHSDIINNLARTGNWHNNLKDDFQQFEYLVKVAKSITVDTSLYQNAGATMVQQLAYALAHANEYLNYLNNTVIARNEMRWQSLKINFKACVSTNYFFEIAKLRALRILWNSLASEYEVHPNCHIMATPSKRNKTIYDYNNNMLRTTTECMSAVLGGANSISNLPYDGIYHKTNEFGERIARNQLLILKHESYFDKIDNPSDGAYYIETLTNQLAKKALELFKDIEKQGGFLKQLKDGTIQRKIKESATKEQLLFDKGEDILLGTNKYPNMDDKMKNELEIYPFVKTNQRKTLIEPILEKRLAEHIEQKRLKNEP